MLEAQSPLSEAEPTSIDELVGRIDEYLALGQIPEPTDPAIVKIVDFLQAQRAKFLELDAAKPPKGMRKPKPAGVAQVLKELEL
jgi:hypothetical protein